MSECQSFDPVADTDSRLLILGSMPGVRSLQMQQYYGHPQNRFWKMLAAVTGERVPQSIAEKKALLLRNHIALHDVIHVVLISDVTSDQFNVVLNAQPFDIFQIGI